MHPPVSPRVTRLQPATCCCALQAAGRDSRTGQKPNDPRPSLKRLAACSETPVFVETAPELDSRMVESLGARFPFVNDAELHFPAALLDAFAAKDEVLDAYRAAILPCWAVLSQF